MNVTIGKTSRAYRTVSFDAKNNCVELIEQRLLPHEFAIVSVTDYRGTAVAIRDMVVRGAGAIGATAAYGLAQGAIAFHGSNLASFKKHVLKVYQTLKDARPTAVDPINAMNQVLAAMKAGETVDEQKRLALAAAEEFAHHDVEHCREIGEHGAKFIRNGMNVLTHCNAGWLAFVDIGTATAPLYEAQKLGKKFHVYCDETRPRSQGATLTAWELAQQKISHQIIADNAAGHLMQHGKIDLVIVGSDRTLGRTGEVANKIGTYTKAVLAHRHKIPFYIAIPLSTIDWKMAKGSQIPIEERHGSEVLGAWGITTKGQREYVRVANPTSTACNPGFDVTPAELITGIITPAGIFKPRDLWKKPGAPGLLSLMHLLADISIMAVVWPFVALIVCTAVFAYGWWLMAHRPERWSKLVDGENEFWVKQGWVSPRTTERIKQWEKSPLLKLLALVAALTGLAGILITGTVLARVLLMENHKLRVPYNPVFYPNRHIPVMVVPQPVPPPTNHVKKPATQKKK